MKELFSTRYTLVATTLVALWWMVAFKQPIAHESAPLSFENISSPPPSSEYPLTPIARDVLHRALRGDVPLMAQLISAWELDAQILSHAGVEGVRQLSADERYRAALLSRLLLSENVKSEEEKARLSFIVDDSGTPIDLSLKGARILPHTFFAAGIFLALVDSDHIIALPKGIRQQTQLYSLEETALVEADVDGGTREEMVMMRPDIAVAAQHYSNPATIEAFRQMGIPLYLHRNISTIDDVHCTTEKCGHLVGRPLKAELMVLFMKAALNAIDNSFLEYSRPPSPPLIVSYHTRFSLPGKKMLTYEYQQRLGFCPIKNSVENFDWEIPITEEEIIAARPEKLIIIAPNIPHLKEQLIARPAIQQLIHNHGCRLYFLDEEVQKTVSQYYVLAYYDLIHSIY